MKRFTRRALLGAAGASLGAVWLPHMRVAKAQDQDLLKKRKLLFLYANAGWVTRHVRMRPPWAPAEWSQFDYYKQDQYLTPDDQEWEFDLTDSRLEESHFSRILQPLYRHRDLMTVTEGCCMLTNAIDKFGDMHAKCHLQSWTGEPSIAEHDGVASYSGTPSTDQRINEFIQQTEPDHRSMDFCPEYPVNLHEWLYRSDGMGGASPVPLEVDPQAAYDRFFGGSVAPGDALGQNAKLAMSLALKQFDELAPRLNGADREKIQAHRELLGSLQDKYGQVVSCDAVVRPSSGLQLEKVAKRESDIQNFANLIAAGFACGVSRVANLGSLTPPPEAYGLDASASIHHEYEHIISPEVFFTDGATPEWLEKEEAMTRRNIVQTESVAKIIDTLRAVPDGEGTLMDSTLVVYMSELANGNHGGDHYPTILFGSGAGIVKPGRYIKYAQNIPNPYGRNSGNEFVGPAHSRLLVAILQGFGIEIDYLGAPNLPGEAPHVGAKATVELSGPLPRLAG